MLCNLRSLIILILVGSLLLPSCKSRRKKKEIHPVNYQTNTLFKYVVSYGESEYYFKVKLKTFADSCSFIYSMTNADRTEGSIDISAWAMQQAVQQDNIFGGGHEKLENKTTVWFSRNSFNELKNTGKTLVIPAYKDSVYLTLNSRETIKMNVDGVQKELPVLKASGTSKTGEKSFVILDDPAFPLIISMNLGWEVKLESISQLKELNLKLKPELFSFKPGTRMYYTYEEFGCGRDAVFEFKERNDSLVVFNYQLYKYACLYGYNDEFFEGTLEIPLQVWEHPTDFVIPDPIQDGPLRLKTGHPFFLDAKPFAKLYETGTATFSLSHFIYNPTEGDYEFMDSLEIAFAKDAAANAGFTKLMFKEADVETGYYMYPFEWNGASRVTETVKLEAIENGTKMLFVFPSTIQPFILSHHDEDLGYDWNLTAIEVP